MKLYELVGNDVSSTKAVKKIKKLLKNQTSVKLGNVVFFKADDDTVLYDTPAQDWNDGEMYMDLCREYHGIQIH